MKNATIDKRKEKILETIVEEYVQSAEPVGSKYIAHKYDLGISSATVRNDMAFLEDVGYLEQPHKSAGRIPTDKGYRHYVDKFSQSGKISKDTERRVTDKMSRLQIKEVEDLVWGVLTTLSHLTCYLSLLLGPPHKSHLYFWGVRNILNEPEFGDANEAELLFEILEHNWKLTDLLTEQIDESRIHVGIGSENIHSEFSGLSLVLAGYGEEEQRMGTIGILGPKRMDYAGTIPVVDYTARKFGDLLKEITY